VLSYFAQEQLKTVWNLVCELSVYRRPRLGTETARSLLLGFDPSRNFLDTAYQDYKYCFRTEYLKLAGKY
jgi:hypothetical protein